MSTYEVTFKFYSGESYSREYVDSSPEEAVYTATLELIFHTDLGEIDLLGDRFPHATQNAAAAISTVTVREV